MRLLFIELVNYLVDTTSTNKLSFVVECVGTQLSTITDYEGRYLVGFQDGLMRAKRATPSIQSQFQIVPIDESKVAFRNILGKYLAAETDNSLAWNRDGVGSGEEYTMEIHEDKVAFKTFHNDFLSITDSGAMVRVDSVASQELFKVEEMCRTGNL